MFVTPDTLRVARRVHAIGRAVFALFALALLAMPMMAQEQGGGEANLKLPDLGTATFLGGINGHSLLLGGLVVSALGLIFGLIIFMRLRDMPVVLSAAVSS